MAEWIRAGLSAVCMLSGLFMVFVSITGVYKFKFALNRMHAAAVIDTLALMLIMLSLIIDYGFDVASLKLLFIIAFFWLAGPVSSHLVSELEVCTDPELKKHLRTEHIDINGRSDAEPKTDAESESDVESIADSEAVHKHIKEDTDGNI